MFTRNTNKLRKEKLLWKQQARDRGEEVSSDDDDDDDEVAAGMDWGDLENENSLSMQRPLLFHTEGSKSVRSAEPGPSLGPVGAGGSAVTLGVPAGDRWMGGDGSAAALEVLMEGVASSPRPMSQRRGAALLPHPTSQWRGAALSPHPWSQGR